MHFFFNVLLLVYLNLTLFLDFTNAISNGRIKPEDDNKDKELLNQFLQSQSASSVAIASSSSSSTNGKTAKASASSSTVIQNLPSCSNKCVKYYMCEDEEMNQNQRSNNESLTQQLLPDPNGIGLTPEDFLGLIDIRQNVNPCAYYFDVCCKHPKRAEEAPPKEETAAQEEPKLNIKSLSTWTHKACGLRNENGIGFKITGAIHGESQFAEFPWQMAIIHEQSEAQKRNIFLCGGSLLHPQVVLTAAHCVFELANSEKRKQLKVRAGEWDTKTIDEPYPHQDRYVKKVIIHEQLSRKGLYNDLALLILDKEVLLAPNVDTICLPSSPEDSTNFDGESCFSSGWGKDAFGEEGKYQEIMKKVQVKVIPKRDCESQLRKTQLSDAFRLHESFLCAGGQSQNDTCIGDGGSPLVCKSLNSESYIQLGIVAWGIGCGSKAPGIYVNLPKFLPWIELKMKENDVDFKYCKIN